MAVILNSGVGTRLYPLTRYCPKALIKVDSDPLLGHQIENIVKCNIKKIIITTGPFENKIKKYIEKEYPNIDVTYVRNPKYRTTNYIYSMWLTKELIDDDVLLMHGDLFFELKPLKDLLGTHEGNFVLVNRNIVPPDKDFKAVILNGKIVKIGVEFSGENTFSLIPMYKLSKAAYLFWLNEIEKFLIRKSVKIYAETVFNEVSGKIPLLPLYLSNEICMEIDTKEDLETARTFAKFS